MALKTEITRDDIMSVEDYAAIRAERRKEMVPVKKNRRVAIGPDAMCYFENYQTMLHQVHEMLFIEKGGEEQIEDELSAYNPLIPQGRELVATVMFEIDEPLRRAIVLGKLGGVEETMFIRVGGIEIKGQPEEDLDRTTADGKASSVQFVHFPFSEEAVAAFGQAGAEVMIGFSHREYAHMAVLHEDTRNALAGDFA